jgi:hypothetical protein
MEKSFLSLVALSLLLLISCNKGKAGTVKRAEKSDTATKLLRPKN